MFVRFPREPMTSRENPPPEWLAFVWAVNETRPDTFDLPVNQADTPFPGYETEKYPEARVIHGPGDEGIRIVADSPEVEAVFRTVAASMGVHVSDADAWAYFLGKVFNIGGVEDNTQECVKVDLAETGE